MPVCDHRDAYGSTVIFVQDRPIDGICILCGVEDPDTSFIATEARPDVQEHAIVEEDPE